MLVWCRSVGVPFLFLGETLSHSQEQRPNCQRQPAHSTLADGLDQALTSFSGLPVCSHLCGHVYRTATDILQQRATQKTTMRGLGHLCAVYSVPTDIDSDQGTHFAAHQAQTWTDQKDIHWHFYLPYDALVVRLVEQMNGLLKQQLRTEDGTLAHWKRCLAAAIRQLNKHETCSIQCLSDVDRRT